MPEPNSLAVSVAILSVGMLLAWIVVLRTGNGGWTDVFWTFSVGASAVCCALMQPVSGWRPVLAATVIGAWSLRLGLHLVRRTARSVEDFRYARLRSDWGASYVIKLFGFLQLQAAFAVPLVVAVAVAASRPGHSPDATDWIGLAVMLAAVAGEAVSDHQLATFAASGQTRDKVLDHGLWGWSRHPNFFFEWLGWCAWPVIAIGPALAFWPGGLALIAPVTMYLLLVRVTGIPPIEERMLRSRGDAYRAYQLRVPPFVPRPPWLQASTSAPTGDP